jgi:2-polyprenyl-3-methyl-5-hydroxy-6-metoxy-1,4-benzoquinol methylase
MTTLTMEAFDVAYDEAVKFVAAYATQDVQRKIWRLDYTTQSHEDFDYLHYLRRSKVRFRRLFRRPLRRGARWLEVGTSFPVLPIALSLLGFDVSAVEDFSFYPPEIHDLYRQTTARYGVKFIDLNFASAPVKPDQEFDYISLMAVIEHLPHTPRLILENIHAHLTTDGTFFLDVPNVYWAYTVRRFLTGDHLQPPISLLYNSGIPNLHHHREYSARDLRYVLNQSGFVIDELEDFNYSWAAPWWAWLSPVFLLSHVTGLREVLWAVCSKRISSRDTGS